MHLPVTPVTAERLDQVSSRNIPRELAAPPSRPQFHEVRIVDRHRVGSGQQRCASISRSENGGPTPGWHPPSIREARYRDGLRAMSTWQRSGQQRCASISRSENCGPTPGWHPPSIREARYRDGLRAMSTWQRSGQQRRRLPPSDSPSDFRSQVSGLGAFGATPSPSFPSAASNCSQPASPASFSNGSLLVTRMKYWASEPAVA